MSVVDERTGERPRDGDGRDDALDLDHTVAGGDGLDHDDPPHADDGAVRGLIDAVVVAACAAFVFWQLHPDLLLADTTPAGGDMGAHVWAFGYLRDVLIPSGRLAGWTPDWYAGFPAFHFYMVIPFVGMVLLNTGLGGVATIVPFLGSLALSAAAAGTRSVRAVAAAAVAAVGVLLLVGLFAGFDAGMHLAMVVTAVAAAVVAGRSGRHPRRWWLAAGAVLVAVVGISFSYGASFKLVSVAGVVAMPVSAYVFGRLARFPHPTPALLSVATLGFLFDKNFTIYGGNIASTMAGEFAFSISLALAIAYLGVLVHGLRTGTHRATAAVLLALVGLCHLIPAFFALGATAVLLLIHVAGETPTRGPRPVRTVAAVVALALVALGAAWAFGVRFAFPTVLTVAEGPVTTGPIVAVSAVVVVIVAIVWWGAGPADIDDARSEARQRGPGVGRLWWLVSVGAVAGLLAAWWVLPFFWQRTYLNDMGWEKIAVHTEGRGIFDWFTEDVWTALVPDDLVVFAVLALVGAALSVTFRNRIGSALVVLGLGLALAFVYAPQGRLWNARLLPFWYLVVYFLAAVGVGEVVRALALVLSSRPDRPVRVMRWVAAPVALLLLGTFLGAQLHNLPWGEQRANGSYRLAPGLEVDGRNFVTDWSRWNYSGYERKDQYPEHRAIVQTMDDLGRERGCGMSLWEYSPDLNDYGTPMALMLLPHWTDGCIGSMEGLYFEASSTTPFHFLMQSELSASPSRAQRDLPYRDLDVDAGVEHMQLMGVRYYMARSGEAIAAAGAHPDLTQVAVSGPWVVYEVSDAPMVESLAFEPAVTTASESQHDWLCAGEDDTGRCTGAALDWFQDPARWDVALAATGPDEWQRLDPDGVPERRPMAPAVVDDVEVGRDGISFTVDRPGTPVLVKQSYFPNWEVRGAEGPYRVAPNLMVVVPTDTEVSLTYGRTGVDLFSILLSLVGIGLVVLLARARPVPVPALRDPDSPLDRVEGDPA